MDPLFLTQEEILEIHSEQIAMYGGSAGLRDRGAFESAASMPSASFGGKWMHPSLADMAAAYLFHLAQNHAFIDGNKRVAINSALTFLYMNDWDLEISEDELVELTLQVARGEIKKLAIAAFFESRMRPLAG